MIKIPTLFKKDPSNLSRVVNEVNPGCEWALDGERSATRKYDGTAGAVINGELYKRYDVKKGRAVPAGAIPCQEPDAVTGHWPHWLKVCGTNPEDKYFIEALEQMGEAPSDGTFELIGPKINGNKEGYAQHELIRHGDFLVHPERSYEGLRHYLTDHSIEGIVFHHRDGRMCKIRKSDFGIKRNQPLLA